jgi:two-component system sensor histidine kinase ChvG
MRLRSARLAIVGVALVLVLLPLFFLGVAYGYERWIVHRYRERLQQAVAEVVAGRQPVDSAARRAGVEMLVFDAHGQVKADSKSGESALASSFVGGAAEYLLERLAVEGPGERFVELEHGLGPLDEREEVRRAQAGETAFAEQVSGTGQTLIFALAAPDGRGGVVYALRASRRGVRRLLVLRGELAKLWLYQLPFVLLLTLLLGRWLVRPLERLAGAARRYPQQPLADDRVLSRGDEIGELGRAMSALAADLEARRRATADLGADVAHEFKNPLATIAADAELVASTSHAAAERRALCSEHILAAVERLRRSIDALLALLRLEASLPVEPRSKVIYRDFLEALVEEYRANPAHRGVSILLDVTPEVGEVSIVASRWAELLRNLLDNALCQPSARREVALRAESSNGAVVTSVRDFGPGVSPGNRARIFQRFFSQRPAGAPPGTGLGLSIASAIAHAHGGQVELASSTGEGALFRVILPTSG